MAINKILLFYAFTPLSDPEAIRLWQRDLAAANGLGGRIIVSEHGINGTVGGEISAVKRYLKATREYPGFKRMDVKWSDGTGDDFPRLSVKVRTELVAFGVPGEIKVDENGVIGGGQHLKPEQVHELVAERPDTVFFDGRNAWEAEIGRFRNAIVPDVNTSRDFVAEIESGKYDHLKDKPIITYCTGGIRCEVLSVVMKNRGFEQVYQIEGGIVRYGETFGDEGLWEGSLYVFDNRISMNFTEAAAVISTCKFCSQPSSRMQNCSDLSCRAQFVTCETCSQAEPRFCEQHTVISV